MAQLPAELIVEILVLAALDGSINNRQRIELSRVCKAGFIAVHRHALLPHIRLHSSRQVHALARTLSASTPLRHTAGNVTRSLKILISSPTATASSPSLAFAFSASSSSTPSDTLYGAVQRQIDVEQSLITPIRTILSACSSLETLHMDLTPAALDYRLRKTTVVSKTNPSHRTSRESPVWTWSRAPISHQAHIARNTPSELTPFRSHLRELVCMQNVLGGGDFIDQLHTSSTSHIEPALLKIPDNTAGRWDRLESLQLLGPRFRLTWSSAKTLGQALPSLKRLALVMVNIMPPASSAAAEDIGADEDEELGRDLFLRLSPLQLLIDTLCPADPESKAHTRTRFEHLLIVGHDLPGYVGGATKLRRWIEGLQLRLRAQSSPSTSRYYVDPDERSRELSRLQSGEDEASAVQPQVQLVTARIKPISRLEMEDEDDDPSTSVQHHHPPHNAAHPMSIARWMLRRARTQTHWAFGPDHPSRAANACLRSPVALNDVVAADHIAQAGASGTEALEEGEEQELHDPELAMEMELAEADEVLFCDDEKEGVEYSLETFELPVTYLSPLSPSEENSSGNDNSDMATNPLQTSSSAFYLPSLVVDNGADSPFGQTRSPHLELPHSYGPSRSGRPFDSGQVEVNIGHTAHLESQQNRPDLEYVDAALRSRSSLRTNSTSQPPDVPLSRAPSAPAKRPNSSLRIETIHPGRPELIPTPAFDMASSSSSSSGASPSSFAANFASRLGSTWSNVWGSGGDQP